MGHHKHNTSLKSFIHSISKETKPIGHIINSGFHTAEHVITAPIHEIGSLGKSLGSSLTIPLAIGGVAVIFLLMRK
jgi:hypothetical protein